MANKKEDTSRQYAVKILKPQYARDGARREKFINEMLNLARLAFHKSIVSVYGSITFTDQDGEHLGMIMEYVQGVSLDRYIYSQGKFVAASRAVPLFLQILETIGAAHALKIIHRDLKPGNIMIMTDQTIRYLKKYTTHPVKVLDFGLAKVMEDSSTTDSLSGATLAYMPPERLASGSVGTATDIYALGAVLYELLTGHPPFTITSIHDAIRIIPKEKPVSICTYYEYHPIELDTVVQKALAKKPHQRYRSCLEFAKALVAIQLTDEPVHTEELQNAITTVFQHSVDSVSPPINWSQGIKKETKEKIKFSWLYWSFNGRIPRSVYWKWYVLPAGILSLLSLGMDIAFETSISYDFFVFYTLFILIACYPGLAASVKRLHDRNRSGWFILISLIPFVGNIWLMIELLFLKGTKGSNMFGADTLSFPREPSEKKSNLVQENSQRRSHGEQVDFTEEAGMLTCLSGEYAGNEIPISTFLKIGSDASRCNLILRDKKISRVHAKLTFRKEDGCYLLDDLGSLNGTYINDGNERITDTVVLRSNDTFSLAKGAVVFKVQ